jgi:adenine-specific DNA-methyltransferase
MSSKQRLELTWIGKENRPRVEPRILLEDAEKSYHAKQRMSEKDIFDNRLIFGDNLLALRALEQEFAGKVKCIYIDPPYNTGSALTHYDDGVEHSIWLSLIKERIEVLWRLLHPNGSLWISIDDDEGPYLRVLMDEIVGRDKFIAQNIWQKRYSRENREAIGDVHEYVIVYAKAPEAFKATRNRISLTPEQAKVYKNPNNDPKGRWRAIPMTAQEGHATAEQFYEISAPGGTVYTPPKGRCWGLSKATFDRLRSEGRIWFGKDGNGQPNTIRYLSEVEGVVPWTWWPHEEVGHTDEAKKEIHALFGKVDAFDTPKPERLMQRVLAIATNPGDLILDSFAGSGTTGAVAHKMNRRWIMVELGQHSHTLIIPRLKKVIDGLDLGGVTEATGWRGGGGFRYFRIAPSLLEKDRFGNLVISKQYNAAMLAEAMCKIMGFTYAPSDELYWQHGHSTETDFIYVTTQTLTRDQIAKLSDEVGDTRSLLICCAAFQGKSDSFANLTLKKIPSTVLAKCEWGHDDYSLNIANLPKAAPVPADDATPPPEPALTPKQKRRKTTQPNLFASGPEGGTE